MDSWSAWEADKHWDQRVCTMQFFYPRCLFNCLCMQWCSLVFWCDYTVIFPHLTHPYTHRSRSNISQPPQLVLIPSHIPDVNPWRLCICVIRTKAFWNNLLQATDLNSQEYLQPGRFQHFGLSRFPSVFTALQFISSVILFTMLCVLTCCISALGLYRVWVVKLFLKYCSCHVNTQYFLVFACLHRQSPFDEIIFNCCKSYHAMVCTDGKSADHYSKATCVKNVPGSLTSKPNNKFQNSIYLDKHCIMCVHLIVQKNYTKREK